MVFQLKHLINFIYRNEKYQLPECSGGWLGYEAFKVYSGKTAL